MSYDLMVFSAHKAPQSETEFLAWYDQQIEWVQAGSALNKIRKDFGMK